MFTSYCLCHASFEFFVTPHFVGSIYRALLSLRKPGRKIWAKVSKKLGGRYTPEECQREHYRSCIKPRTLRHKQKKEGLAQIFLHFHVCLII